MNLPHRHPTPSRPGYPFTRRRPRARPSTCGMCRQGDAMRCDAHRRRHHNIHQTPTGEWRRDAWAMCPVPACARGTVPSVHALRAAGQQDARRLDPPPLKQIHAKSGIRPSSAPPTAATNCKELQIASSVSCVCQQAECTPPRRLRGAASCAPIELCDNCRVHRPHFHYRMDVIQKA